MVKQVINVGTSTNDGSGDTLRVGAQKINDNFTELYGSIAYTLPTASTSVKGGVIIDGITLTAPDGILGVTGTGIRKLNAGAVDLTLVDDGDITGRLTASGPLIVLTGGDGNQNASNNYTQLQWTSDLANPDTTKSQYLWLDTNGISLETNKPGVYSNVLHYDNSGILTFNSAGKVGPVQEPNGIDLFASSDMSWAQLNYDNRNFVWVTTDSVKIDVLTTENFRWEFTNDGRTLLPGGYTFPLNDGMYISGAITEIPDGEGGYNAQVGPVGLTAGPYGRNNIIAWGNTGAVNGVEDWAIEMYSDHSGGGGGYFAQFILGQNWNTTVGEYSARAKSYLQNGLSVDLGDIIMRNGSIAFKDSNMGIVFGDGTMLTSGSNGSYIELNGNLVTLQNDINSINNQIGIQNDQLDSLNGQLSTYQAQYEYWLGQPDYFNQQTPNTQKFSMLSQLSGQIGQTQNAISLVEFQIAGLNSQLATAEEALTHPQLTFDYNASTQQLLIDNGAHSTVKFPNGIVFGDNTVLASADINKLTVGQMTLTLNSDGVITTPDAMTIDFPNNLIQSPVNGFVRIATHGYESNIRVDSGSIQLDTGGLENTKRWLFGADGTLRLPRIGTSAISTYQIPPTVNSFHTEDTPVVIYSRDVVDPAAGGYADAMKATIHIRSQLGTSPNLIIENQISEMMIVKKTVQDPITFEFTITAKATVFNEVYTTLTPIATFDVQINESNNFEITMIKDPDFPDVEVKVLATESIRL